MDNTKIKECFSQPMELDRWKWAIKNHIGHWVKAKGKSYWEVVRHVSISRGVLKDISREKFGELLLTLCSSIFDPSDTSKSLKYDMDKFRYNKDYINYNRLPDSHLLRTLEEEVHALFDTERDDETTMTPAPTIESRLGEYLYKLQEKYVNTRVIERPTYCNFTATFSMEQYMSRAFFNQQKPSQIMVFECVNDKVDAIKVTQLAGQYMDERKIKLFIVSTHGFDNRTYSTAENRDVGLIKIDPKQPMDESCFVLWRSEDTIEQLHSLDLMLVDRMPMSVPMIIVDGDYLYTSFTHMLQHYGFQTVKSEPAHIHAYDKEEIEETAYNMVKDKADHFAALLKSFDYRHKDVPYFEINPYQIARKRGIKVKWEETLNMADINIKNA